MIQNRKSLYTDVNGMEVRDDVVPLFDLAANDGDVHDFIADIVPSHWHSELEVFLLLEGRVRVGIGEEVHEIEPGGGCFINAGVIHSVTALVDEPCRYRSFVFDAGILAGMPGSAFDVKYIRPLTESGPSYVFLDYRGADAACLDAFGRAFDACALEDAGFEFRVREALTRLIWEVIQKSRVSPTRAAADIGETRLKQMLTFMDAHIGAAVTLADIAASANVCPRECQRIFGRYLHERPMAYMQRIRVFHAAQMLSGTGKSVTEIALDCGFSSPGYFARKFQQVTGQTPTGYRGERWGFAPSPTRNLRFMDFPP